MAGMNEGQTQCPSCGAKLPTGLQYCTRCGARIGIPPPPGSSELPRDAPAGGYYAAQAAQQGVSSKVAGCAVIAAFGGFLLIIAVLVAIALPNYIKVKEKAKEAEVKANLHEVQLSLERFAVDTEGAYPSFLIGGDCCYSEVTGSNGATLGASQWAEMAGPIDVLKLEGYILSYPGNPFVLQASHEMSEVHEFQVNLPASLYGNDPLRNGTPESRLMGTRFGADCTKMGSVLGDPRRGMIGDEHTWADVDFGAWDIWETNTPKPFLPGQFFYSGIGPEIWVGQAQAEKAEAGELILPTEIDQYIVGAYGGIRTKGKDILGDDAAGNGGFPWTVTHPAQQVEIQYGNPNGIRDAIILVLTAGEDYQGDR